MANQFVVWLENDGAARLGVRTRTVAAAAEIARTLVCLLLGLCPLIGPGPLLIRIVSGSKYVPIGSAHAELAILRSCSPLTAVDQSCWCGTESEEAV